MNMNLGNTLGHSAVRNEGSSAALRRAAVRNEGSSAARLGIAKWLCLAATPVFALMALITAVGDADMQHHMHGSMMHGGSALSGMATMYLLMSLFHSPPWLRRISRRRRGRAR